MQWLSRSDTILLGVAVYFAVMALVRLMQRRRDELVADVQRQVDERRNRGKRPADDKPRKAA
jgi:uncharacterized membrane protein